LVDQ